MKRILITVLCLAAVFTLALAVWFKQNAGKSLPGKGQENLSPADLLAIKYAYKVEEKKKKKEERGYKGGALYVHQKRANQITGEVSEADVLNARNQMTRARSQRGKRGIPLNLQWEDMGPDNVGGRTRGFWINPSNPKHLISGGVTGGLFHSFDEGLSWESHPSNAIMRHLGVTTIRQSSNGDIYVGTGEAFNTAIPGTRFTSSFIGDGIYKSTDGGQSFNHLQNTIPAPNSSSEAWAYVSEIAISSNDPQQVFAATRGGLKVSNDGGENWSNATTSNGNSYEVVAGGNGVIYAEVGGNYYRSDDGVTFTELSGSGGFPSINMGRVEFAVSPQDPNYVYAVISTLSGVLHSVIRSTDAGLTWSALIASRSGTFDVLGTQGVYDIALGVDPLDKNRIFVGGQLEMWCYQDGGWNKVAYWTPDDATNPYYVHADMHGVYFSPADNNIMYVVSDGGIAKSYDATQQFPTFTARNKNYNVTQFYYIASNHYGFMMGGSQDNGTILINLKGNTTQSGFDAAGGDGGGCEMSGINPNVVFGSTYQERAYRSSNGGGAGSFGSIFDNNCDRNNDGGIDQVGLFVLPSALWEQDNSSTTINGNDTVIIEDQRSVWFLGVGGRLWFTTGALNLSSQPYWYDVKVSGTVSEIEAAPDGTIFCGTSSGGNVYRVEGLGSKYKPDTITHTATMLHIRYVPDFPEPSRPDPLTNYVGWEWTSINTLNRDTNTYQGMRRVKISSQGTNQPPWGGRYVNGIAVDPHNNNHVAVALGNYGNSNYVYRTTNAMSTFPSFTSIQGDLPAMPVYDVVIDYNNSNNIIIGTELGMWATTDQGAAWNEENSGMVTVPVFELVQRKLYEDACPVIYAGTHGRGIFRTTTLTPGGCKLTPGEVPVGIIEPKAVAQFQVYPNPVYDKAIVEFNLNDESASVTLQIVDLLGRLHRSEKLSGLSTGANKREINFNDVSAGVYLVVVHAGNTVQSKRVFVTK